MTRRRTLLRAGAGSLALAGLGGCAVLAPPPDTAALRQAGSAPGLPLRAELDAVPFVPQTPLHCGPAALATALGHAGLPADVAALGEGVFLPARGGSLAVEMLGAARRAGAVATRLPGQLPDLLASVAAGQPVVMLLNLGLDWLPQWHYAVLVGYDRAQELAWLRSGTQRRAEFPFATLERTWARGGRWALTLLPPEQLSATATEADALQAALGFERAAPPARAAVAYASFLARWPGRLVAQLGLGNARLAGGDAAGAAQAFAAAAQQHDSAIAWINLAHAQLALGERAAAREAAQQALRRTAEAEPVWRSQAQAVFDRAQGAKNPP